MIKQCLKQSWQMLRANPLLSLISIVGTALSIAMIMIIVLQFQIKLVGFRPESNRDRMLYVYGTRAVNKAGHNNNGGMSAHVGKMCYYPLQTPESVTLFSNYMSGIISGMNHSAIAENLLCYTDANYWDVFDFKFIDGRSFSIEEFNSAIPVAVINEVIAQKLFGLDDPIGKTFFVNSVPYQVVGVVQDGTKAASDTYAHVWLPYTVSSSLLDVAHTEGTTGSFSAVLLAKSAADFDRIREELNHRMEAFNEGQQDFKIQHMTPGSPMSRFDFAIGNTGWNFKRITFKDYLFTTGMSLLFVILIPSLNLIGIIQSSIKKRSSELAIRRTFGASRGKLILQILTENMIITLAGTILGLLFSLLILYLFRNLLINYDATIHPRMIFKPLFFIAAMCFAILLNLITALVPAWNISRKEIVNALK